MITTNADMLVRLDSLERQNLYFKRIGFVVSLVLILITTFGAASNSNDSKIVEAQSFVIRDKDGKIRAKIGVENDGSSGMKLFDTNGVIRIQTQLNADGVAGFSLNNRKESKSFSILADAEGDSSVFLSDLNGVNRLQIVNMKDSVGMIIRDREDQVRAGLGTTPGGDVSFQLMGVSRNLISLNVNADGSEMIDLIGRQKQSRIGLGFNKDGVSSLDFIGGNGIRQAVLFSSPDGKAGLTISNKNDQSKVGIFAGPGEASNFTASDSKGKTRIKIGAVLNDKPEMIFFDDSGIGKPTIKQ